MSQRETPAKPPKETLKDAEAKFDEACQKVAVASEKLDKAASGLKRTVSTSKMKAVTLPTPSQLDLELAKS